MAAFDMKDTERIIRQYSDMIYRIAIHHTGSTADAEDIMQDVCVELLTKCPCREDSERLKAWLIRVTLNKCSSLHRFLRRRTHDSLEDHADLAQPEQNSVMEEIRQLPGNMRDVVYLYYYEDYTIAEVSEILGKNPNTVSSTLQRARRKLRELFEEGDGNNA